MLVPSPRGPRQQGQFSALAIPDAASRTTKEDAIDSFIAIPVGERLADQSTPVYTANVSAIATKAEGGLATDGD